MTSQETVAADYAKLRNHIDAVAALARDAQSRAAALDRDAASLDAKTDAADRIWSDLMREVAGIDR